MKKENFIQTQGRSKQVKKKGLSHGTPVKIKGRSVRPSRID